MSRATMATVLQQCRRLPLATLVLVLVAFPARAANDGGFSLQWNLGVIGAETAWPTGTGLGITIAIVDTGVDLQHPDLAAKLVAGHNFVNPGAPPQDDHGHGTHVAGIAAAVTNNDHGVAGVAADARILPVKVLGADGTGTVGNVASGIRWAADNGAAVINVSIGVEQGSTVKLLPLSDSTVISAVRYASNKGAVCVLAAGNDPNVASAYSKEPALVVGATDKDDHLAAYSSRIGKARDGLVAPGGSGTEDGARVNENILSTYWFAGMSDTYAWAAGTSMAAPHVAGAAAILRGLGLTPDETISRITSTAKDLGDPGNDDVYGHGRLDLAKAVAGLTPVETHSATGAQSTTPSTQLRTTPTTRVKTATTKSTTTTTVSTTTSSTAGLLTTTEPAGGSGGGEEDGPATAVAADPGGTEPDGDDGLPLAPPLVATGLLATAIRGLVRARRVSA